LADNSITNLKEVSTPTADDLTLVVTDVATLPVNKKSTLATFFNKIPTWLGFSTTPIVYTTGEIDVTTPVSFLSVTGSTTFSLPAGTIGQVKVLVCTVAASTPLGVLTPVASGNDGYDTITFSEVGESVTLIYENSGWIALSRTTPSQVDSTGPTSAGTSTSFSAGTGFTNRRKVLTLGSGNDDNTLTLTAADSGSILFVTPTNNITIILPLVGDETGIWFDIIVADKINKDFDIKTSGQDGADNISMRSDATDAVLVDVGAADHDILTIDNMLEGSRIELINVQGGDAELWHAYIRSNDTVDGSIA
jgi:hypothetical protein